MSSSDLPIDNEVLRDEALRQVRIGTSTWAELARACGYDQPGVRKPGKPREPRRIDTARLKRALGLVPCHTVSKGKQYSTVNKRMKLETAIKIGNALGLDPVDWET